MCVCENVGNKGCVLANHGLDATVCFAIRFKVLIWRMRDLECYFSITTELKHNLYQDVDSQCICIYRYILYTFTSFWKCILQTLNMMRHFKADYSYIVQLMYGYRILLHSSHLIPGTSERFRTVQKYRFFPELFRTISEPFVFCAQHTTERFRTVQR